MPRLGAAFAAGAVSREHVEAALRTMRKLSKRVLSSWVPDFDAEGADSAENSEPQPEAGEDATQTEGAEGAERAADPEGAGGEPREVLAGEAVDKFFARHSRNVDPNDTRNLARTLLERIDPDGHDGFDPDAVERRSVNHSTDANGMVVGRFQLDPVSGAWFRTAIEHFSAPNPTVEEEADDGASVTIRDNRKAAQRRADALGLLSRLALGSE
jgi:hypothetical protein